MSKPNRLNKWASERAHTKDSQSKERARDKSDWSVGRTAVLGWIRSPRKRFISQNGARGRGKLSKGNQ